MTDIEIEKLADALARRLADKIVGRVSDWLTDGIRQVENTVGHEADRIAARIVAKMPELFAACKRES